MKYLKTMTFLKFKTSLVIASQPASVIMTQGKRLKTCARKSICDSLLRFRTKNKRHFLNIGDRFNFVKDFLKSSTKTQRF